MKSYYLVSPPEKYPTRYKSLKKLLDTIDVTCTLVGESDVHIYKNFPKTTVYIKDLLSNVTATDVIQAKRIMRRFLRKAIEKGYSFQLLDKFGHTEYSMPSTSIDFLITYAWRMGEARLLAYHDNDVWNDWLMIDVREGINVIQEWSINFETVVEYALEIRQKMISQ